jgi:thioesterase domain-containing protein/acyl carrier protein
MTPSAFREFAAALPDGPNLPSLRRISIGGETVRKSDIELARRRLSKNCVMVHQYGATETGTNFAYPIDFWADVRDEILPIGMCIFGHEAVILDEEDQPVETGRVGELAIRGRYIATGYWRRPDATERSFVQDPVDSAVRMFRTGDLALRRPDGFIVHKGRRDFMHKIRGQRVEIHEVEDALAGVPGVSKAAVTVRTDARGEDRLVAYVVPGGVTPVTIAHLRTNLGKLLPEYMMPSAFVFLGDLPQTPHGKVDRMALPEPASDPHAREGKFVSPRDDVERRLAGLWEDVLSVRPIGVKDNFFELGGHSLNAARLFVEIERAFGRSLPLPLLLRAPTVEQLAAHLTEGRLTEDWGLVVPLQPAGERPPLFCIDTKNAGIFAHLARRLGPDQPVYGLHPLGLKGPSPSFTIPSLASLFLNEVRKIQPQGPYYFCGLCAGAIVGFEMAQQLRTAGEEIALLAMLDSFCPTPPILPYPLAEAIDKFRRRQIIPFAGHLRRMLMMRPPKQIIYLRQVREESRNRKAEKAARRAERKQAGTANDRYLEQLRSYLHSLHRATRQASFTYSPKPWPGRLVLILTEETNIDEERVGSRMGWVKFALQGVESHTVAGMHQHALAEPNVGALVEVIRPRLGRPL